MKGKIIETELINHLIRKFARSPVQMNCAHDSDAEILKLDNGLLIAVSTDSIVEEIQSGLYDDPYLIGWMAVTANLSDLAAVGANPAGILISEIIPPDIKRVELDKLQEGINDALISAGTFVLGGDTSCGESLILAATALGIITDGRFITRKGCRPGDILYTTGCLGKGNAFAISHLIKKSGKRNDYFPKARIVQGSILKKFATACIDSSDGALSSLDQLARLNKVGFKLSDNWESIISPGSVATANNAGIPVWLLLAGVLGEYELIFTINPDFENTFLEEALLTGWKPLKLGITTVESEIRLNLYGKYRNIDSAMLRNLGSNLSGDVLSYMQKLLEYDLKLRC